MKSRKPLHSSTISSHSLNSRHSVVTWASSLLFITTGSNDTIKKITAHKVFRKQWFLTPFAFHVFHFILVLFSLAFVLHFVGIYLYVQLRGCFADWQRLPRPLRLIHYHLIAHLRPRVIVRVISFCDELPVRCLWTNVRVGRVGEPGRRIFTLCKLILELCYYRP